MAITIETWLRLIGGIALLLGNGFFVTTEFALTRVRQFDESEFTGSRGLERAWDMTERLEIYLSGCQVGITVCSVGVGVVAEPAVAAVFGPLLGAVGISGGHTTLSVGLALATINLLHVIVGEQAPTYLGIERAKVAAGYGSGPLYWWTKILGPVIKLADWTAKAILRVFGVEIDRSWAEEEIEEGEGQPASRSELRSQMGQRMSKMGMSRERVEEVISAIDIGEVPVRDIMIPADEVVALTMEADFETNRERMAETSHVRFPLVRGDFEEFIGVVYSPTVLHNLEALKAGRTELKDLATAPMTVEADLSVSDLIDQFQAENQELALVLDDGAIVGAVTATDAFEQITGELEDPMDAGGV